MPYIYEADLLSLLSPSGQLDACPPPAMRMMQCHSVVRMPLNVLYIFHEFVMKGHHLTLVKSFLMRKEGWFVISDRQQASPSAVPKNRLDSLDTLRAVAALAVVMIHVSAAILLTVPPQGRGFQVAGFINQFSRFAVPAFVLITGAGLFYNYGRRTNFSAPQYYWRRLKSLGVPYLFWSITYTIWYAFVERNFHEFGKRLLVALLTADAVYTFYYFLIVVPFYLLFPLVRCLARSRWMDLAAALAIVGNGIIVWFAFPHPKVALGPFLSDMYPYAGFTPLWWMGPFLLGGWMAWRWEPLTAFLRRTWVGLMALAAVLLIWVMREFYTYVSMGKLAYVATNFRPSAYWYGLVIMLGLVGVGAAWTERASWVKKAVLSFGKYSFGVYLVHPLFMQVTAKLLHLLNIGPVVYLALNLILVLTGSYLAARLIDKIPGGSWVIGLR
jgi:surface polysaccharide O-acyltransferase-like enzyme